jgi:predicted nucleic acid-binding Zn ribbon protein
VTGYTPCPVSSVVPTYEYACHDCEILFEELLISQDEVRQYSQQHPCKKCGKICGRVPSASNFVFKGVAEGDPTKVGNSGSHDLDYPSLDKAIGRSANRKWKEYAQRKEYRDRVRRESGTNAVTVDGDKVVPTDPAKLEARQKALRTFRNVKSSG